MCIRVQVMFLHRGSAAKDGTEQDGAFHQRQWRKKRKRPVLSGEAKQEAVVSLGEGEEARRTGGETAFFPCASSPQTFSFDVPNDGIGG